MPLSATRPEAGLQGKRVLSTGGLGFIGSNLARRCLALGATVAVYDNLDPHAGGNLYNVEDVKGCLALHFHDLLDFDALVENVYGQDIVFNCAASTSHPFSMREPWFDLDVNSRGVVNLVEAMRRFNPDGRLIHLGTSTQLGKLRYRPADENHPEFPTDIYSANKSASEKYVLVYARAHGLNATVVRLSNVYGPRATIRSADFTFNNYFVGLALQGSEITVYGEGRQLRNVLFVDDAVEALVAIAAAGDLTRGETYFAVGDDHFSVAQIAEATVRQVGKGAVRHVAWPDDRKATEIGDVVLTNAKLKQTVAWQPRCSLDEGLSRTAAYYAPCLARYL